MNKVVFSLLMTLMISTVIHSQGFGGMSGFGDMGFSGSSGGGLSKAMLKTDEAMLKMEGNIVLRFFNALDGKTIQDAAIEIPNAGTFITGSQGQIVFPALPDGNYTAVFSKEGFITTDVEFRVLLGGVDFNWYSISPGIPNRDFRVILEWGERPADLDLHFEKSGGYHISYTNMKTAEDGNAVLDIDARTGFGPETITIGRTETANVYNCYVVDYTNRNNSSSGQMAQAGARVRVYSRNRLVQTIQIPANARGTRWNVFKIERGTLIPVNTVSAR